MSQRSRRARLVVLIAAATAVLLSCGDGEPAEVVGSTLQPCINFNAQNVDANTCKDWCKARGMRCEAQCDEDRPTDISGSQGSTGFSGPDCSPDSQNGSAGCNIEFDRERAMGTQSFQCCCGT